MFAWLREILEIRAEFRERKTKLTNELRSDEKVCQSCETLRQQLEIANYEKEKLLNRILEKPEVPTAQSQPVMITRPRTLPWNARKQLLEKEDRERAKLMRDAVKPDAVELAELEKELGVAEQAREATTGQSKES